MSALFCLNISGYVMKLPSKLALWGVILLVVGAVWLGLPATSKSSLFATFEQWGDDYTAAVEQAQDSDDDDDDVGEVSQAGQMMVVLDDEAEAYVGVETIPLQQSNYLPEIKAHAQVVNLKVLLEMRSRYRQVSTTLNIAKVKENAAEQELSRLKDLAKGAGSVAVKNVNYAETNWQETRALRQGLQLQLADVRDEALQHWGETIAIWVTGENSTSWRRLLSHKDSLLLVTLPVEQTLPTELDIIYIAHKGLRENAREAHYVAPALITDQFVQGETYYFRAETGKLRTGMTIDVWLPQGKEALEGIFIPDDAIIWYAGQPWVYIQLEDGQFQRRSVQDGLSVSNGVFMQQGCSEGELLVLHGAQMLLSEEFRWKIQDEDDD